MINTHELELKLTLPFHGSKSVQATEVLQYVVIPSFRVPLILFFEIPHLFPHFSDMMFSHFPYPFSVLPRLRFCAIVPLHFEYDAAKTVPAGHLAHLDFGLSQDFESVGCVENSHAKNNIVFHRNSRSCDGYFDWCIGFLNCTGTSVQ